MAGENAAQFARLGDVLGRLGQTIPRATDEGLVRLGSATLSRLKLAASGRPGPRRVTGDYTRRMNMQADRGGPGGVTVTIGGTGVQGPRLEVGFHGADSLGRHYHQGPFPHYAPTYDWANGQVQSFLPRWVADGIAAAGAP
jgi:hypothetical protein